jgi:hypothetical protein
LNRAILFAQASPNYSQNIPPIDQETYVAAITTLFIFMATVTLIAYIIVAILLSRIFKKAGVAPWKAWIPIYSNWILLELGGQKGFWAVVALIPFVSIISVIYMFIAMYYIGLRFGKRDEFVLFAVFLPLVWYAWLAFDNSVWKKPRTSHKPHAHSRA